MRHKVQEYVREHRTTATCDRCNGICEREKDESIIQLYKNYINGARHLHSLLSSKTSGNHYNNP
jgi:hypothetical protein